MPGDTRRLAEDPEAHSMAFSQQSYPHQGLAQQTRLREPAISQYRECVFPRSSLQHPLRDQAVAEKRDLSSWVLRGLGREFQFSCPVQPMCM